MAGDRLFPGVVDRQSLSPRRGFTDHPNRVIPLLFPYQSRRPQTQAGGRKAEDYNEPLSVHCPLRSATRVPSVVGRRRQADNGEPKASNKRQSFSGKDLQRVCGSSYHDWGLFIDESRLTRAIPLSLPLISITCVHKVVPFLGIYTELECRRPFPTPPLQTLGC